MNKAELRKHAGIFCHIYEIKKNRKATLTAILKIVEVIQCNAGDMMKLIKEDLSVQIEAE